MLKEKEEQKVQVREWGRLKLVGRPVMTSKDSWVAIRPLPRLLHLYYDSNLQALLRFPEDPIFLFFVPSKEDVCDGEYAKASMREPQFSSLLVLTSDGCLWLIAHINFDKSINRPAKRLKQNVSRNQGTEDEWDIFEDCDIYKDTDLYPSHDARAGSSLAWNRSTKTQMLCKLLNSHAPETSFRKVQARCVQLENLVGRFPGACLAVAGPDNLIAVACSSGSPILLTRERLLSKEISPAQDAALSNDCHSDQKTTPSSLLFATMKISKNKCELGAVLLSPRLFSALCQGFVGAKPKHLLLQGNASGEVRIFSIDLSNQISSSMVLCDLQEPISELVAYPLCEDSDALLVLSAHGCLIAMTPFKSKCISTPFLTSDSEFSLWKLFRIDMKDAFDLHSLRVDAPLVSATMYGSGHLCFCSASSVCIFSILEAVDGPQKQSRGTATRAASEEGVRKKSLACKSIPVHDIFVALAGGGSFVGTKTRSLIALTSRGRLLALKLSDDILVAQKDCCVVRNDVKSWKPRVKKRDENVMVLLNDIATIESCTEALEVMKKSIDLALSELAAALRLTCDVLSGKDRYTIRSPHRSFVVPSMSGLHCNLEVNPLMPSVALNRLCFSPVLSTQTSKFCHKYAEQSSNFKLCLKVTLSNCSSFPVSSYWTLLLDINGLKEASSTSKMYISSVINDGYGLAPGASKEMAFQVSCAEVALSPLEASVYLCHIHEYHNDVLHASPKLMKSLLQPMEALSGRTTTKNGNLNASSRAICILLARYRVDILSLLRPPQRLQHLSDSHYSHLLHPRRMGANAENFGTDKLRPFLVKLQLSFMRRSDLFTWSKLSVVEKWKEFQLEDLKKCCVLSKDGEELSATDIHGNTTVLTIDNKELGREGLSSSEIQISASTLQMGCMVREAVLWRWKQDFEVQKRIEPDRWDPTQNTGLAYDFLEKTQKRLDLVRQDTKNLESLWCANLPEQSDFSAQSVGEADTVFEHILEMYMSYRENDASNPYWRCVRQIS